MAEVTDLHILAKMAEGPPSEDDAYIIRDESGEKVLHRIHSLKELVEVLPEMDADDLFPSLCRYDDEEEHGFECGLALWIHYILGDAVLSAKIYHLVEQLQDEPKKLKLEIFNLCFNRYLNFQEILTNVDDFLELEDESSPSNI
jgi:hypothetical protein